MSIDYAILGFLNYHPYSGYDLKKVFDTSVAHFWSADQSQIYRTLSRLMKQGFVEMEKVEQDDRPDRKVYHITETGHNALVNWLAGPAPYSGMHSGPMVQVFFMGQLQIRKSCASLKAMQPSCAWYWHSTTRFPKKWKKSTAISSPPRTLLLVADPR